MQFDHPYVLLLEIVVLMWLVAELVRERRRVAPLRFPAAPDRHIQLSLKARLRFIPTVLRALVLALIVVALAGPKVAGDEAPIYQEGIDIVIAFDISTSMRAMDFEPSNRFDVARETIATFVDERKHDRLGLVVFAGQAFTQCPLTLDHAVFKNILAQIRMGVVEDGTAIGESLGVAVNRLRDSEAKSKVVVLLTDGVNNAGSVSPETAAGLAAEFGVKVYTVQVGTGGRVPYPVQVQDPFTGRSYERTRTVEIPVNPQLLQRIAKDTGGRYFKADDSQALRRIFDHIDELEKTELPDEQFVIYQQLYAAFALPALLLLLLELVLRHVWIRKFP